MTNVEMAVRESVKSIIVCFPLSLFGALVITWMSASFGCNWPYFPTFWAIFIFSSIVSIIADILCASAIGVYDRILGLGFLQIASLDRAYASVRGVRRIILPRSLLRYYIKAKRPKNFVDAL